ncbi:MAG: phosphonate metabolism protein/1,5-bisphosphokinase (PRPP-forming) PhnN [Hyphomicrobiales bacterium]|nr:phosphonate metabolism protein/1,5-bisphosphokinase (PRPP-forming) PhnN [Hyphomicrobiales bacterium]
MRACLSSVRCGGRADGSLDVTGDRSERGTLVLVVGPSGVGKDTLIDYCRGRLSHDRQFVFPRRSITRTNALSEDHEVVPEEDFVAQIRDGAFLLHWDAHGLRYGIPSGVEEDLGQGRTVVVNVSRGIVDQARARFQPLIIVSLSASESVLASRLRQRARESAAEIARRLAREAARAVTGEDVIHIDNSGDVAESGALLLSVLLGTRREVA